MADVTLDAQGGVQGSVGTVQRIAQDNSTQDNSTNAAQDWLDALEKSKLTPRYYATIVLIVLQEMFEFYDFFLVGYIVSVLAPGWHLTYGQSAMMLLSSGVGAITGALIGGKFADILGAADDNLVAEDEFLEFVEKLRKTIHNLFRSGEPLIARVHAAAAETHVIAHHSRTG